MAISWLPTTPSTWRDIVQDYADAIPASWPAGLWDRAGEAYADIVALGRVMGYGRLLLEWLLDRWMPWRDTDELWLDRWERAYGLSARGDQATRARRIAMYAGAHGTGTMDRVKELLAQAWASTSASGLSYVVPSVTDVEAGATLGQVTRNIDYNSIHFYSAAEDEMPDWEMVWNLINLLKPTWQKWSAGQYQDARASESRASMCAAG